MVTDRQLESTAESDLVPYQRGVSLGQVAKGALARFLPGTLITMIGAAAFLDISIAGNVFAAVGGFIGIAGTLTAGFGLGLFGLRRWLYPDAKLDGRRSFVAGLISPLALFIAATGGRGWTIALLPLLLVVVGVILALGMYFAWLTPTPEDMRGDEFERDPAKQITEVAGHAS